MIQEESKMLCVFRCSLTNSGIRVTLGNVVFYQMFLYLRINECMIFNCFLFSVKTKVVSEMFQSGCKYRLLILDIASRVLMSICC